METGNNYIKKKKKMRKIKMRFTSLLFAMVFILLAVYYLLQSDLMNLKIIEINGNNQILNEEIIDISSLVLNRNVFKYNLQEIETNIVSHPYIKDAKAQRKLPKAITIKVKEREEYAIIPYMGSYIYIDKENVALRVSDSYIANDYILITGVEFKSFKIGEEIQSVNIELLARTMELLDSAKATSIFEMISEININQENNIRLITLDGAEVLLGKGENPEYIMLALNEILINLYTKDIRNVVIDMRYEGHISVKQQNLGEE